MDKLYNKDFDTWNGQVSKLDATTFKGFFYEPEIWWCALGVNIGSEQDGKNESFERPVLIVRKVSKDLLWIVPFTSKISDNEFMVLTGSTGITSELLLRQFRSISCKRLLRKIGKIKRAVFFETLIKLSWMILSSHKVETPPFGGESRSPKARV